MKHIALITTILVSASAPAYAHEELLVCDYNSAYEQCEGSNTHKANDIIGDQQEEYTGNDFEVGTEVWIDTANDDAGVAIGFTWWF